MDADELAMAVARHMRAREGGIAGAGLRLEAAREGFARVSLLLSGEMLNGHGMAHGGLIFTLADTAFAYACNSRNEAAVAQQASIVFLSPAQGGELLVAEAVEQAVSGRSGVYAVTVTGADGRVVAMFQGLSRTLGRPVLGADEIN